MKKIVLTIVLLAILFVFNAKPILAESNITDTKLKIIQSCEKIFPDLEKIGVEKFRERYQYFENFRSCTVLFNNPVWYTNDIDRLEKLSNLLDQQKSKSPLQSQSIQSRSIPEWIKVDAKKWQQGIVDASIFSQGIRYLINTNIIQTPIDINSNFCETGTCVGENDFVMYSIKNNNDQDIITLTHTFHNVDSSFIVTTDQVSKNGKTTNNAELNKTILVNTNDLQCCDYHDFIQSSLSPGLKINSNFVVQLNSEVVYPFKDQKRTALVAKDLTGSYYEIVDKQTGIIIFAKHQDRIKKTTWTAELLGTNMFSNDTESQNADTKIPLWFKRVVQWWIEGKITDDEYISGIVYLMKLNVLRV